MTEIDPKRRDFVAPTDPMVREGRPLDYAEIKKIEAMKIAFEDLWVAVDSLGTTREISIAKTKLEESCLWVVKHLGK